MSKNMNLRICFFEKHYKDQFKYLTQHKSTLYSYHICAYNKVHFENVSRSIWSATEHYFFFNDF